MVDYEETIQDMMVRYDIALGSHGDKVQLLWSLMEEYTYIKVKVFDNISKATETANELEEIALSKENTLTSVEYIKRLIKSERKSSRPNKENRYVLYYRYQLKRRSGPWPLQRKILCLPCHVPPDKSEG